LNGFRDLGGQNLPFPILKASGLYNSLYYRTSRDSALERAHIRYATSDEKHRAGLTIVPNVPWHRALRREEALRGTKN